MVSIFNKSSFWHGHWIQCSSHFWVPRLESSILLLKKYPEFLNIPTILGRYHYNIYSMMDFSYQEIYHNLPLKLRQNWMLWDTRICNSWINGWPHFTFIYTVLIYIYTYTPYAPCMEYLPTFTRTKSPSFVGKYTFYEAYGYIYIYQQMSMKLLVSSLHFWVQTLAAQQFPCSIQCPPVLVAHFYPRQNIHY